MDGLSAKEQTFMKDLFKVTSTSRISAGSQKADIVNPKQSYRENLGMVV